MKKNNMLARHEAAIAAKLKAEYDAQLDIALQMGLDAATILKAAGWKCVGQAGGLRWTGKRRPEVDLYPAQMKIRFEMEDKP